MRQLANDHRALFVAVSVLAGAALGSGARAGAREPIEVSFATSDGGEIHADLYGDGTHAVVLAHGAVFDKESWGPLVGPLTESGLQVLAIDFRGYGDSRAGTEGDVRYLDILAAIAFLRSRGANRVSVVGASLGGGAAARAAVMAPAGEIDRLILLAPAEIPYPERMQAQRLVYISSEADPSISRTRGLFESAPEPKSLEILPGDAHAQHIFKTAQSDALVELIRVALKD